MNRCLLVVSLLSACAVVSRAAEPASRAAKLPELNGNVIVLGTVRTPPLASMLPNHLRGRLREANQREAAAWGSIKTKADWERFRARRLQSLRTSLGDLSAAADLNLRVIRTSKGEGYTVDNIVYETAPGVVVAANLYRPAEPGQNMPGIVIVLSHQRPKHNGSRQDMAMTWARAGCLVLLPDPIGAGERRQHPFHTPADYPKEFPASQDYYFRYDLGIQLDLAGASLMGWFVRDLMRGIDVLLAQPGIDKSKIAIVSEPAGGGDVAGVLAAVDPRVAVAVVTNFGGPEPEDPYPLPPDAEQSFNYSGSGSWESTRNLKFSARDGFLPWTMLAAAAPRKLVYNHEFYWDKDHDPVWTRLKKVYELEEAADHLAGIEGYGFVVGSAPDNSHWIPINREMLYPLFERWLGIKNPGKEYSKRLPEEDLHCFTPKIRQEMKERPVHEVAGDLARRRALTRRVELAKLDLDKQREALQLDWLRLLGNVTPRQEPVVRRAVIDKDALPGVTVERIHLATEPGIVVPVLLLMPAGQKVPVVVAVAQEGKQAFLKERSPAIDELLAGKVGVCLPDLRGTGETSPGGERGRRSTASSLSATALMNGTPLLGSRLRDLRAVLRYLRSREDVDAKKLALWGDSFAPVNPAERDLKVPRGIGGRPHQAEPLGGLLALLAPLYEDDVRAVYARGGLAAYESVFGSPFTYVPHDVVVPGVFAAGDLGDVTAVLAPRPVRLEALVDGQDRLVNDDDLAQLYAGARRAYDKERAANNLAVQTRPTDPARWLLDHLK
ncbi:MAG: hypothetical protein AB7K24_14695 [Gemmataceae bacterium]